MLKPSPEGEGLDPPSRGHQPGVLPAPAPVPKGSVEMSRSLLSKDDDTRASCVWTHGPGAQPRGAVGRKPSLIAKPKEKLIKPRHEIRPVHGLVAWEQDRAGARESLGHAPNVRFAVQRVARNVPDADGDLDRLDVLPHGVALERAPRTSRVAGSPCEASHRSAASAPARVSHPRGRSADTRSRTV